MMSAAIAPEGGTGHRQFHALVLAGDRGPDDPLRQATGVDHKCLTPIGGRAMIEWVVDALAASPWIGRIVVSVADPHAVESLPALRDLVGAGTLTTVPVAASPSRSVLTAIERLDAPFPLLITTADHALLTTEMVDLFCANCAAGAAEVGVGLTAEAVVSERYPHAKRTYLAFRDGRYSGSNIFALMAPEAAAVVRLWVQVEQQRKRPWRIAAVFGPTLLLGYLLRRFTLDEALLRISSRVGLTAAAVRFPFADAAIDVDKIDDLALAEEILDDRRRG